MQRLSSSLGRYGHTRMVIMAPGASVYDAARALEANHIGCVVVAEAESVLGIVTDRDLALRVIGYELDPRDLTLRDVMTPDVATLPVTATEAEAAQLMLDRHVRRVPIEDQGRVVGMVTLDDLVLGGFDTITVSHIIRAQLAEPAPLKDRGPVHPTAPTHESWKAPPRGQRAEQRHAAHAKASYDAFLRRVIDETGLTSKETAETAVDALLAGVIQRIRPEEASDMLAQLPAVLRERLSGVTSGPDRHVTLDSIERVLSMQLGIDQTRAHELIMVLGRVLGATISRGELADMKDQLPEELRAVFS